MVLSTMSYEAEVAEDIAVASGHGTATTIHVVNGNVSALLAHGSPQLRVRCLWVEEGAELHRRWKKMDSLIQT